MHNDTKRSKIQERHYVLLVMLSAIYCGIATGFITEPYNLGKLVIVWSPFLLAIGYTISQFGLKI